MWRRLVLLSIAPALLASTLPTRDAAAADFLVFPIRLSLPLQMVVVGFEVDQVTKTKLKETDLVNLALGRALGTKVDKKTAVLAVAVDFESPSAKLIVFNPSETGPEQVTTTVATTTLDFESADVSGGATGQGTLAAQIQETTLGDSDHHALHATTALATGSGKSSQFVPPGLDVKISVKGLVAGRLSFTNTVGGVPTTFAGFVVNGKAKVSGKVIGSFSE